MAVYNTEIQTGGGGWQQDEPLTISIANRGQVVPADGAPSTGTTVSWSGEQGNGSVTFFDGGSSFQGTAQFPGEGPVGYRGALAG
jgi:OAA-family lectin sugar binding domain